jgi:hypothetical protein
MFLTYLVKFYKRDFFFNMEAPQSCAKYLNYREYIIIHSFQKIDKIK